MSKVTSQRWPGKLDVIFTSKKLKVVLKTTIVIAVDMQVGQTSTDHGNNHTRQARVLGGRILMYTSLIFILEIGNQQFPFLQSVAEL